MKCKRKDRIYYCVQCGIGGLDPSIDVCCTKHEIVFCDDCWEAGIDDLDCWEAPYNPPESPESTDGYIQPVYTAPLAPFEIKVTFK